LFVSFFIPINEGHSASTYPAKIVNVINAYSLEVIVSNRVQKIRLAEIYCPDQLVRCSECVKGTVEFIREVTQEGDVLIEPWVTDSVGRKVSEVFLPDGRSLGRLLVLNGYALQDRFHSGSAELQYLEGVAKKQNRGGWEHHDAALIDDAVAYGSL
jgi:endonuclease YncB( thermonuclease family)